MDYTGATWPSPCSSATTCRWERAGRGPAEGQQLRPPAPQRNRGASWRWIGRAPDRTL